MRPSPVGQLLEMRGISKSFSGIPALLDVDVLVHAGEVHSIVGQNGAGKSTLMHVLAGVHRPDAGEIRLGGRRVVIASAADAFALGIATVYQELSLLPNLTIMENVLLGREPRRGNLLDRRAMAARTRQVLAEVGCSDLDPAMPVGALPLAQRQLVEIAKALSYDPRVLILDEPTAPLGRADAARLFAIVAALKARGVAIIFISHRFAEVLQNADCATILRNGRVVETLSLDGVTEELLTERMIGRSAAGFYATDAAVRAAAGPAALEVRGVSLRRRLHDVSFELRAGELLGLTGLLGAGQNELARIVAGDLRADAGAVVRGGRTIAADPQAAIAAGICLLTEDRKAEGLFLDLSVAANITLPSLRKLARLFAVDPASERKAAASSMGKLQIVAASPRVPMRTLSGGNQQKTMLARWLLRDLAVLVLIEPTRGIDVGAKADIYRDLEALKRLGKAILMVSSDVPEILGVADRILVLVEGRVGAAFARGEASEEDLNLAIQGRSG